jgi:hypothetical protein
MGARRLVVYDEGPIGLAVPFEERRWTPWWVILGPGGAMIAVGAALTPAASHDGTTSNWITAFPFCLVGGLVLMLVCWGNDFFRKVQVRTDELRLGRARVPYEWIDSVRYVDHAEAKRVAKTMRYVPNIPSTWRNRRRAYGAYWQPWMKDALFLHVRHGLGLKTDDWLIGTRHPQELLELILSGMDRSRCEPDADLSDGVPASTWLPSA